MKKRKKEKRVVTERELKKKEERKTTKIEIKERKKVEAREDEK